MLPEAPIQTFSLGSMCIWPRILMHRQLDEVCLLANMCFLNRHELRGWYELGDDFTCLSLLNLYVSDQETIQRLKIRIVIMPKQSLKIKE